MQTRARQSTYVVCAAGVRVLRAHELKGTIVHDVTKARTVMRMLYATLALQGFVRHGEQTRLQTLLRGLTSAGYLAI